MRKEYLLQGLNCANCAAKIESALAAQPEVESAAVHFVSSSLTIDFAEGAAGECDALVRRVVLRLEPGIVVQERHGQQVRHSNRHENGGKHGHKHGHGHEHSREHGGGRGQRIQLLAGAAAFVAAVLADYLLTMPMAGRLGMFLAVYLLLGGNVVWRALRNLLRGRIFDENFLMVVATVGAFATGYFSEAAAVMLFYQVGEAVQSAAVRRSRRSIAQLMDIRPDYANLQTAEGLATVAPETVQVGDIIVVKPGEKIPLDGVVVAGESMLDTAALTGESLPRSAAESDAVLSGCINQSGLLTIRVTKAFGESTAAKIIDLVEHAASKKAPTEHFITAFSRYYTPAVVGLAVLLAVIPPLLLGGGWAEWIHRGLISLVISCPCALVISIPLGFFGGIGGASRRGILVKGGNYLEALNKLDVMVFDKTGTLTKGVFQVQQLLPAEGVAPEALLETAALAEANSNHPIARSVMQAYGKAVDSSLLSGHKEIAGHGVTVMAAGRQLLAGDHKLMAREGIAFDENKEIGTKIYVAAEGVYLGCIIIADEVKEDSRAAIAGLRARGIAKTAMLTGDHPEMARRITAELGLDEGHGGLLPDQKVAQLERLMEQKAPGKKLAYVGDGINDAPVLARADVGIAMGALGSDAAIEAADVVLMTDEPSKLLEAIDIARFTRRIVWQNILFALGVKGLFLLLGALGVATMWEAVFADVGVALLAILNALRVLRYRPGA